MKIVVKATDTAEDIDRKMAPLGGLMGMLLDLQRRYLSDTPSNESKASGDSARPRPRRGDASSR